MSRAFMHISIPRNKGFENYFQFADLCVMFDYSLDCSLILHSLMVYSSVKAASRRNYSRSLASCGRITIWMISYQRILNLSEIKIFSVSSEICEKYSKRAVFLDRHFEYVSHVGYILSINTVRPPALLKYLQQSFL